MYICLECNKTFGTPKKYLETYGFDIPPYKTVHGCPSCGGNYVQTEECEFCGKWITGEYVKLQDGTVVCDNCYEVRDITDWA